MVNDEKKNIYIGNRYVPKVEGNWDKLKSYESLSIVLHEGISYTSKKNVPVGIDIANELFWVISGNYNAQVETYRSDVRNLETKVNTEIDIVNDRFDKTTPISLNDPKYEIKGDGLDETDKIRLAFEDAMTSGKSIELGNALTKYTLTESIVIDRPLTIYANGRKSTFEQLSWAVPVFEIRSPDVSILGSLYGECNQSKTYLTKENFAVTKNNSNVFTENPVYFTGAGVLLYVRGNFDRMYIDKAYAKGFIGTMSMGGDIFNLPESCHINTLYGENVDFVYLGTGYKNLSIGVIEGKNIVRTQMVDEHVAYFTEANVKADGLHVGAIISNGIETPASHIVSLKSVKNYYIGEIKGSGKEGTFFTSRLSNGYIGRISGTSNVGNNLGTGISIQDGTFCEIESIDIESEANFVDLTNRGWAVSCVGDGQLIVKHAIIRMKASNNSHVVYSSATVNTPIFENIKVIYVTPQVMETFHVTSTVPTIIKNPSIVNGVSRLVLQSPVGKSVLYVNPNEIGDPLDTMLLYQGGTFDTVFTSVSKKPLIIGALNPQPAIRSTNVLKTNNPSTLMINEFKYGTNGQEFYLISGDVNTIVKHNDKIVLKGGVDIQQGTWKLLKFVWWDAVSYQI